MLKINKLFLITSFFLLFSCSSDEKQVINTEKKIEQPARSNIKSKATKVTDKPNTLDIMSPLSGTDSCFQYVELVRDSGDVDTYRSMGDSILLKKDDPARDEYKTYISIIGDMIKKDSSIAEIRQKVLDVCRELQKPVGK
jgi:hypothetical protein